jgi:drug/metabolite transporter (DMT)-like permease
MPRASTLPSAGLLLFVALAAIWGIPYALIKVALRGFEPEVVVFGRLLIGALMLVPLAIRSGAITALRGRVVEVVLLAAVQIAAPLTLITVGERWVSSSLAGTLVSTTPLFVALLAVWVDHAERPSGLNVIGLALGITGVALMLGFELGGGRPLLGGAFVLLAALGYAIGALATRRRFAGVPAEGLAAGTLSASAVLLAVPAAFALPAQVPGAGPIAAELALGVLCSGLAFLLFYGLIARLGAARASLVAYVAPCFAVVVGVAFLGDRLSQSVAGGLLLILSGSWLASRRPAPAPKRERVVGEAKARLAA